MHDRTEGSRAPADHGTINAAPNTLVARPTTRVDVALPTADRRVRSTQAARLMPGSTASLARPHVDAFLAASLPPSTPTRHTRATSARPHGLREDASKHRIINAANALIQMRTRRLNATPQAGKPASDEHKRSDPEAHNGTTLHHALNAPRFLAVDRIRFATTDSHRTKTRRTNQHRAGHIAPLRVAISPAHGSTSLLSSPLYHRGGERAEGWSFQNRFTAQEREDLSRQHAKSSRRW